MLGHSRHDSFVNCCTGWTGADKQSMRLLKWMIVVPLMGGLIACSGGGASVKGLSQDDADRLNARSSRFESSDDPPIVADTHVAAGDLAVAQGSVPLAIEQYTQALKLDPTHRRATYALAMLYTQQKVFDKAMEQWEQYVEITHQAPAAYANLGYCSELAGQPQQAESAYQKGIARDPKNMACRVNYGLMLARHGRTAEAMVQLQAVLTPAEVHYNLASVYEQQGRIEQAKMEYRKALSLEPRMSDAQQRLARLEEGGRG